MAKKIDHRGHERHRELLLSLCPLCSMWFSKTQFPEDTKKSLNSLESTQSISPPFPLYVPIFVIRTSALLLFAANIHQN